MRLTESAREAINTLTIRTRLAVALGVSEQTIRRYIANYEDDNLTKAAALACIKRNTGMTDDEILDTANDLYEHSAE